MRLRRFLIAAGIAGAVMLTALLVAPMVVDWNGYRATLSAELSRATGRTVSLGGPIEVTLLPSPRILANNVSLSGPDTAAGELLRLRAVELQVRLLPLLTGHVVVERLTLVRPEILVETDQAGHLAWVMDGAGGDLLPDIALQRFAISDGTLVWRDHDRGVRTRVEKISLKLSADALTGPAKAEGSAEIDGVPVRITAGIGGVNGRHPVSLNVALEANGLGVKGEFVGQYLAAERRITGRLKVSAGDARGVLAAIAGRDAAAGVGPALIAHPASLEARVSATPESVDLEDLVIGVADQRATGTLHARIGDASHPTDVEATLSAPHVDLDRLATVPALAAGSQAAPATLPRDLRVALHVTSDAVLAGGKAIHGLALDGTLDGGAVTVNRFEAQLPGAGAFSIAGTLAASGSNKATPGGLRFTGTIDAHAANLRDLLSWLDVGTGAVPAGRLANAVLKAKLAADASGAELSDIDLHLDSTRASGTARIAYGDRSGMALDLTADHLDYDAYVSDDTPSATVPAPNALANLSGEGRFAFGRLTYRGVDLRDVALTAVLADGDVTVAQFSGAPPEAGELMPEAPVAAAATAAPPLAETATQDASPPSPTAHDPAPPPAPEPSAAETRDSFVRGILDFLGR
jgi:AsmA family